MDGYVDPLLFMGLIGASIARGKSDIWYSDGSPKTEADLMRVPWAKAHIREEHRRRAAWRHPANKPAAPPMQVGARGVKFPFVPAAR